MRGTRTVRDRSRPRWETAGTTIDRRIAQAFWQKQAERADDSRSVTLDRTPGFLSDLGVSLYQGWFLRRLARRHPAPCLSVDVGCGPGMWTAALARVSERVIAFDVCAGFVEACRRRVTRLGLAEKVSVEEADAASAPIARDADVVVLGAVVQYLGDSDVCALLRRVRAALSPGGIAYLRTTVSTTGARRTTRTASFQGIYRTPGWYRDEIAAAGFHILDWAMAPEFVSEEISERTLPLLERPLGALWRLATRHRPTDIVACILRADSRVSSS